MKNLFVILIALISLNLNAQILEEGFESGSLPTGWTQEGSFTWTFIDGDGATHNAHTGSFNAFIAPDFMQYGILTSSGFDISTAVNPYLSFWYMTPGDGDNLQINYKTSALADGEFLESMDVVNEWTLIEIALPNATADYYIEFFAIGNGGDGILVDDVTIYDNVNPELMWSGTTFTESSENDGSISTTINLTLTDETFTVTTGAITGFVTNNVPEGLTVEITATSNTEASILLTGNATNHQDADDISDMEITFTDEAFTNGDASVVETYSQTNLIVDFDNNVSVNSINNNNISIYPNPTTDFITIESSITPSNITITDITGRTIQNFTIQKHQNLTTIDLSDFNNGIYIVKIQIDNEILTSKIIKN